MEAFSAMSSEEEAREERNDGAAKPRRSDRTEDTSATITNLSTSNCGMGECEESEGEGGMRGSEVLEGLAGCHRSGRGAGRAEDPCLSSSSSNDNVLPTTPPPPTVTNSSTSNCSMRHSEESEGECGIRGSEGSEGSAGCHRSGRGAEEGTASFSIDGEAIEAIAAFADRLQDITVRSVVGEEESHHSHPSSNPPLPSSPQQAPKKSTHKRVQPSKPKVGKFSRCKRRGGNKKVVHIQPQLNAPLPIHEAPSNPPAHPNSHHSSSPTKPQLKRRIRDDQKLKQKWNDKIAELRKRVLEMEQELTAKDSDIMRIKDDHMKELEGKEEVIKSLRESKRRDQKAVNDVLERKSKEYESLKEEAIEKSRLAEKGPKGSE
eukprot:CAMPEP_0171427576 /NCGR_PEP_ID=MMETSP0881-20121228/4705_1 /TAXON_ID=67004 /ORGANISM="Thalassiosira weissflogii, Strain CCMP1336" /LENGTH=374 /DNA_ID=CAMNT_0011947271 /DNA_START=226 /DNA_END=1347 /DNA_ORIENTATION=+